MLQSDEGDLKVLVSSGKILGVTVYMRNEERKEI
jgi:hypothetical protein